MLAAIKELIRQNDLCVLATAGAQGPHTSLMAYTSSDDCTEIYLITPRHTLKFRNIVHDNRVSLMIDSRRQDARRAICALTVAGRATEIDDPEKRSLVAAGMRAHHRHLEGLADRPDVAWLCVRVDTFQLQNGVRKAQHLRLSPLQQG